MFKALAMSLLLGSAATVLAQLPAPVPSQQIVFRHWPEQFIQWIGPELPYTMIELYVDPAGGTTPLYETVLTDRSTGKRIHYANQQGMVDIDKRSGAEAYLTTMQFDRPANEGKGATYMLRFVDHAGQPVSWQFIQGSDISERGGRRRSWRRAPRRCRAAGPGVSHSLRGRGGRNSAQDWQCSQCC